VFVAVILLGDICGFDEAVHNDMEAAQVSVVGKQVATTHLSFLYLVRIIGCKL